MNAVCDYSGSYYDQTPWTEHACAAEDTVPAGCPVHFVIGAELDPSLISAVRLESDGTTTPLASTASLVDTVTKTFTLPDEFSCDCAPTQTAIAFQRFAVVVPDATAGDTIAIQIYGGTIDAAYGITAAASCPADVWPSDYEVALACDRCSQEPDGQPPGGQPPDGQPDGHAGCKASSDPGFALVAFTLLFILSPVGCPRQRGSQAPPV
jgi:hypothetical protein